MRRRQGFYCFMMTLVLVFMAVLFIHRMRGEESFRQHNQESEIPIDLSAQTEINPTIRVLIKTSDYRGNIHSKIELGSKHGLIVETKETTFEIAEGEIFVLEPDSKYFQKGSICIKPRDKGDKLLIYHLGRSCETPSYRGSFEVFTTAEGMVLVNELSMEEYLWSVVPSEMPSSYEEEALKVQAVCARSYACYQTEKMSYPEYRAHVDDSTSFQVYGNYEEKESTTRAVNDTFGEKLWYQGKVAKTYFYSTSCGHSTSIEAWGSELSKQNSYLKGVELCDREGNDYEKDCPWYRWSVKVEKKKLQEQIELRMKKEIGALKSISIEEKGVGNIVKKLKITGSKESVQLTEENEIRRVLGGEDLQIEKQDGTTAKGMQLLPSAFFTIEKNGENYIIKGGGYGHGIGMSQNGANEMAKCGMTYREILEVFYPGTKVK